MPNPTSVRRAKGLVRSTLHQLMMVDVLRYAVASARYGYFALLRRRLRTFQLPDPRGRDRIGSNTLMHNLKGLRDLAVNRSNTLVRPLSVLDVLEVDAKILSIGPRTEGELLNLVGHGFRPENIHALDLISYSPWVQLGDMHELPHPDSSFDAVLLGWVLAYSDDRPRAAREVVRVLRPGGIAAVGVEYNPLAQQEVVAKVGYLPGGATRIASCDELLACFGDSVDRVYFRQEVTEDRRDRVGALATVFSVRK